jgi:plasmid stabilization system protein ParE
MKLRFTRRAIRNIETIADYIHERNPAASERVRASIYDSLQDLILFPYIGRAQQAKGVRKFVTRKYRYIVYYTVDESAGEIIILNVKHPAQRREHEEA